MRSIVRALLLFLPPAECTVEWRRSVHGCRFDLCGGEVVDMNRLTGGGVRRWRACVRACVVWQAGEIAVREAGRLEPD